MITLYLRAKDEAALIAALPMFRATDENGAEVWRVASHSHALDVIGTLYTPAVLDENHKIVTLAEAKHGFHANLRLFGDGEKLFSDIPLAVIVAPKPSTPDRIWA